MTGPSILHAAVEELYSHPMAEFTTRRKALAADARKAGDRASAAQIAGLRKPTLAADTLNRLVRAAPEEVDELLRLGVALRAAEKALNGPELRELTVTRRKLVTDLMRLAFDITGQPSPSASVRDEVSATLNAALADERVADLLTSGVLVTQARWDGFGSTSLPELAAVLALPVRPERRPAAPDEREADRAQAATAEPEATVDRKTADRKTADRKTADREAADREAAERDAEARRAAEKLQAERERRRRWEAARQEADDAETAARSAQQLVTTIDRRISELSIQLAHQRSLLADAQHDVQEAQARRRAARLALTRAGGDPNSS